MENNAIAVETMHKSMSMSQEFEKTDDECALKIKISSWKTLIGPMWMQSLLFVKGGCIKHPQMSPLRVDVSSFK